MRGGKHANVFLRTCTDAGRCEQRSLHTEGGGSGSLGFRVQRIGNRNGQLWLQIYGVGIEALCRARGSGLCAVLRHNT